jgi:hypothetical protein
MVLVVYGRFWPPMSRERLGKTDFNAQPGYIFG